MARISVEAEQEVVGRRGFIYQFNSEELQLAATFQYQHHVRRMAVYEQRFLNELERTIPKGMTMNRSEIDIEHFDVQAFATTYSTSNVMRGESEEARGSWHQHRNQAQEYLRYAMLFRREPKEEWELTFDDIVYFGMFGIRTTSLVE